MKTKFKIFKIRKPGLMFPWVTVTCQGIMIHHSSFKQALKYALNYFEDSQYVKRNSSN